MKYMKKIKYLLFGFVCFMLITTNALAASVSIKASSTNITKGNTVTITATVSSETPIVSSEGSLSCSGAGVNGGANLSFDDNTNSVYSKSFSTTLKPTTSGTITCSVSSARLTDMGHDNWQGISNTSIRITVNEPVVIKRPTKEYSSNNNLKSLEIEGYTLEPVFTKDTKEYSIEVANDVTKVNIKATSEDNSAKISGLGEIEVSEGTNKLEVKVTAENGNVNIYVINVTVKELDPIEVTIDKEKYLVVRKEGLIDPPENYEKDTVKINDQDVLCYKNKKTKTILIALKDSKGNIRYYKYDEAKKTYTKYQGLVIGGIHLSIENMPNKMLPKGYSKINFKYDEKEMNGYQYIEKGVTYAADDKVSGSDFYLIYAVNEETGKKNLYVYDKLENTVQRYDSTLVDNYKEEADNYFLYLLVAVSLLALTIITCSIILIKKVSINLNLLNII